MEDILCVHSALGVEGWHLVSGRGIDVPVGTIGVYCNGETICALLRHEEEGYVLVRIAGGIAMPRGEVRG